MGRLVRIHVAYDVLAVVASYAGSEPDKELTRIGIENARRFAVKRDERVA